MKKLLASLLAVVLMVTFLTTTVYAENGDSTTTGGDTSTDESTTTTEDTPPTSPAEPQFEFVNNDGTSLQITWNAEDFPGVSVSVVIDGTVRGDSDSTGNFTIDLDRLVRRGIIAPGVYEMAYQLSNGTLVEEERSLEVAGELNTEMTVSIVNNRITAQIIDEEGRPLADYPINLLFSNYPQATKNTDANGRVTFDVTAPSDHSSIMCTADNRTVGFVRYTGYAASPGGQIVTPTTSTTANQPTTTPPSSDSTTSTSSSQSQTQTQQPDDSTDVSTTTTTYSMVQGAGTTAVVGQQIAVNVSFDTHVAESFGYSSDEFARRARLLLGQEAYDALVGQNSAVLMMEARSSSLEVTDQFISTAISGQSAYSRYTPADTLRIPLDLSLHLINAAQGIDSPIAMPGDEVTVELPVPASMSDEEEYTIAIAILSENGITRLIEPTVENGILSFPLTSFSSVAILGFQAAGSGGSTGGIPIVSIILIVVGVLLLVGAGLLIYFFFLRKPAPEDPEDGETVAEEDNEDNGNDDGNDNGGDIHSFSQGYPSGPSNGPGGSNAPAAGGGHRWTQMEQEPSQDPAEGVSLGDLMNQSDSQPRKKRPSDYDLDL